MCCRFRTSGTTIRTMDPETKSLTRALLELYYFYKYQYEQIIKPRRIKYNSLNVSDQTLLPWYESHTDVLLECIDKNKMFLQHVAVTMGYHWGVGADPLQWESPRELGFDRVRSLLLQIMREWSDEGQEERDTSYNKLITGLNELYPYQNQRSAIKVLVPGCGLGRLIFELNGEGYDVEGNEFGYHVIILNQFFLNFCNDQYEIFPFLHKLSNVNSRSDQVRGIIVFKPIQANLNTPDLKLVGGSFIDIYGPPDLDISDFYLAENHETRLSNPKVNVVITCFFIDTSPNIIEYLKSIRHILIPEGIWINFGPLQWHFEHDFTVSMKLSEHGQVQTMCKGLELTKQDLLELIQTGFNLVHQEFPALYAADKQSLSKTIFTCDYWVATVRRSDSHRVSIPTEMSTKNDP